MTVSNVSETRPRLTDIAIWAHPIEHGLLFKAKAPRGVLGTRFALRMPTLYLEGEGNITRVFICTYGEPYSRLDRDEGMK